MPDEMQSYLVLQVYSKGRFTKVKFIRNQKVLALEKGPFPACASYSWCGLLISFANSIHLYINLSVYPQYKQFYLIRVKLSYGGGGGAGG